MAIHLGIGIILIAILLFYFRLARHFNIVDKPNERSSHKTKTIRGGGIVFPFSALLWFVFFDFQYPWFISGLILIAAVSFLDDVFTLSTKPRLLVHLLAVILMLYELNIFTFPWFWWIIAFILIIGWINAFNFMDGINGITAFYAFVTLLSFYLINREEYFMDPDLLIAVSSGLVLFGFFNARKRAMAFAGDIGSIGMAFILAFIMIKLMLQTGKWEFIILFAVYGVDTIVTIIQRLLRKENIFKAHRSHLYQYLANEKKIAHVKVSALYALIQLSVNLLLIASLYHSLADPLGITVAVLAILPVFYLWVKHSAGKPAV